MESFTNPFCNKTLLKVKIKGIIITRKIVRVISQEISRKKCSEIPICQVCKKLGNIANNCFVLRDFLPRTVKHLGSFSHLLWLLPPMLMGMILTLLGFLIMVGVTI